jgi:hypothetical protein
MKSMFSIIALALLMAASTPRIHAIDLDGNGISDVFERIYNGGIPLDPAGDPDADGRSNLEEYFYLSDPHVQDPPESEVVSISPAEWQVRFFAPQHFQYRFATSEDMQTWTDAGSLLIGADDLKVFSHNPESLEKLFIRVRSFGPTDTQDDLLNDWEEAVLGTSTSARDTDGDGLSDDYEWFMGLNPLLDDATGDLDADGTPNNRDADSRDPAAGEMFFQINTPTEGGSVP